MNDINEQKEMFTEDDLLLIYLYINDVETVEQGWPQDDSSTSLVLLVQVACKEMYSGR